MTDIVESNEGTVSGAWTHRATGVSKALIPLSAFQASGRQSPASRSGTVDVIVMILATLTTTLTTGEPPRKTLLGSTEMLRVQLHGKDIVKEVENLREALIKTERTKVAFTRHASLSRPATTTDTTLGTHRATTTATASLTRPTVTETKIASL